jgi:uncharacterized membrane-anchored protein
VDKPLAPHSLAPPANRMHEHDLRRQVVGEMHLRRWPPLAAPCLVMQWLRLTDAPVLEAQRAALESLSDSLVLDPGASQRHVSGRVAPDIRFTWECHSEASSFTLFVRNASPDLLADVGGDAVLAAVVAKAEALPGDVIRASRIWIATSEADAKAAIGPAGFLDSDLVSCRIGGGARLWSDFRIRDDGYGRLLVAANGTPEGDLSRLIQRLQELGNYRNLALLGLPIAQASWPRLNAAEERLQALAQDQVRGDVTADVLLERLSALSFELMSIVASASYRMSATAAYAQLVEDRLAELQVTPIAGFPSLIDFTQRRFLPAVRTCAAFTQREGQISLRAAQFTALLRTGIETRIQNQNARLLASMERSAAMQLRLQQLVEGLSVVAVSYYTLALIGNLLNGIKAVDHGFEPYAVLAPLTIPVVLTIWLGLRWMKKRLLR